MSRTERRGYDFKADRWHGSNPDWSCRNPNCCGGEVGRKERRRERANLTAMLRRDPEAMPVRPMKGSSW